MVAYSVFKEQHNANALVFLLVLLQVQRRCARHGTAGSVLPVPLWPSAAGVELSHKYTTYDDAGSQEENGRILKELATGVRGRCRTVSGGAAWPGSPSPCDPLRQHGVPLARGNKVLCRYLILCGSRAVSPNFPVSPQFLSTQRSPRHVLANHHVHSRFPKFIKLSAEPLWQAISRARGRGFPGN